VAAIARVGGGRKSVTQATVNRRNLNFKLHWKLDPALALASVGAAYRPSKPARRFGQESAMLETPILVVLAVLVIVAILWSIFR